MSGSERLEEIAGELDRIADQLGDAAMDVLRSAMEQDAAGAVLATKREKLLNRARSSAEKAKTLVRQADALGSDG
jgi:ElaB/YqjD/DUF883 family membrane-anchored ribosome-binding protein